MANSESSLSLVIKAVDLASAPLRALSAKLEHMTAPVRELGHTFHALGEETGITKLGESVHHVGEKLHEAGEKAFELGEKLLTMEALGVFALVEIVKKTTEAGEELKLAADRTGLTVDSFAQLRFAAGQAGVKQEEFTSAMDAFNKRLGEAKAGGGSLLTFLEKVSPALAQQVRHAKDTQSAFNLMAAAFEKVQDPSKRAALQAAAFGKSSKQMATFLGEGREEIAKLMQQYDGIAGSQEEFANLSKEQIDAMNETSAAFDGLRAVAAVGLLPAITELTKGITAFVRSHRDGLKKWAEEAGAAISAWVKGGGLQRLTEALASLGRGIGWVVDHVGGLKGVAVIAAGVLAGPFLMSVVQLGGALAGLLPAVGELTLRLGVLAYSGVASVVSSIGTFVSALRLGFTAIEALQLAIAPTLLAIAPFVLAAGGLAAAGYQIWKNWEPLKETFLGIVDAIGRFDAKGIWNSITGGYDAGAKNTALAEQADMIRGGDILRRTSFGAQPPQSSTQTRDARVTVDFSNLPKGARVSQDKGGTQPVDLSMGWSTVSP